MDPMTLSLVLAGTQVVSGFAQGEAIRQNAKFKEEIDNMNAEFAEVDAYNAEKEGIGQGARYETNILETIGQQRVAYAANNIDVNFGTAAEKQADTKIIGNLNVLDIQKQARDKGAAYVNQAINSRLQGSYAATSGYMSAQANETAGILNAGATGVSGYERYTGTGKLGQVKGR